MLIPATRETLATLAEDRVAFGTWLGLDVPAGWPESDEAADYFEYSVDRLRSHPDEAQWWLHFFAVGAKLVGWGGFAGPPQHGVAEIGYEIAPEHRRQGFATAAASALLDKAWESGEVATVIAHTRPHPNPSTGVLTKLGFTCVGAVGDPVDGPAGPGGPDGPLWRWERDGPLGPGIPLPDAPT